MAGKRSWIDEAATEILAKGRQAARAAKRTADNTLRQMGDDAVAEAERQQEASRMLLGDPTLTTSRNPFRIFADMQNDPRFHGPDGVGHNDIIDARRHAEASRRVSSAVGTPAASLLGLGIEAFGLLKGEPSPETVMDLHNNREGRRAFVERRTVDPRNLQVQPRFMTPSGRYKPK